MGLLDKVNKKAEQKEEPKEEKKEKPPVDVSSIKKHIENKIKKQETKKVEEPTVHIKGDKINTFRPEGTLKELKNDAPKEDQKQELKKDNKEERP